MTPRPVMSTIVDTPATVVYRSFVTVMSLGQRSPRQRGRWCAARPGLRRGVESLQDVTVTGCNVTELNSAYGQPRPWAKLITFCFIGLPHLTAAYVQGFDRQRQRAGSHQDRVPQTLVLVSEHVDSRTLAARMPKFMRNPDMPVTSEDVARL